MVQNNVHKQNSMSKYAKNIINYEIKNSLQIFSDNKNSSNQRKQT